MTAKIGNRAHDPHNITHKTRKDTIEYGGLLEGIGPTAADLSLAAFILEPISRRLASCFGRV